MTSNTLLYKDKGPKCTAAPQIFLIFVAVFIFHQSFTTQNGLGITFMLKSWPYLLKTLSYVVLIVAAAVLATNWNAKYLLCLSIAGIGMLHLIQGILDQTIDAQSEQLDDFFRRLMSIAYGVTHAPVLPCVYVLLARLTSPQDRATAGSFVFSAKQFSTVLFLVVTTCCANDNSFLKVYYATYSIFGLIAVIWSIVYYFVGFNCDLEFVDQAPSFKPQIPWSSILSSLPVWTLILSHASSFAAQVVTMNRLESIRVSKYVVLLLWVMGGIGSGWLSDALVAQNHLTRLKARKIFNSLAICVPMSAFIVMFVLEHTSRKVYYNYSIMWTGIQVILIVLTSFQSSGFMINHIDLSPYYAGILIAVTEIANQIVTGLVILGTNLYADQLTVDWFLIVIQILLAASSIYMGIFFAICSEASIQEKWSPVPLSNQDQNRLHKV